MENPAPKKLECLHTTHIDNLPDIILAHIFHFVPAEDLVLNVKLVCKRWATVSRDADVWRGKLYAPILGKGRDHPFEVRKAVTVLRNAPLLENFCVDLDYPEQETILAATSSCEKLKKVGVVVYKFTAYAILKLLADRHSTIQHLLLYFYPVREFEIIRSILNKIGECENLKSLVMHGSGIFTLPMDAMPSLSNLQKLVLYNLDASLSYRITLMFQSCTFPSLEILDFGHDLCVWDTVLDAVFQTCKNLKRLRIVSCTPLTENGFASMHYLEKLQVFHLENCPWVRGGRLVPHIVRCKSLVSVCILRILGIRMRDMMEHWESMPLLNVVDIDDHCRAGETSNFACNCSHIWLFEQL